MITNLIVEPVDKLPLYFDNIRDFVQIHAVAPGI